MIVLLFYSQTVMVSYHPVQTPASIAQQQTQTFMICCFIKSVHDSTTGPFLAYQSWIFKSFSEAAATADATAAHKIAIFK